MLESKRLYVTVVALAMVASACVRGSDPGIGLQNVQTDVAFAAPAAPANTAPKGAPSTATEEPVDVSDFDFGKGFLSRLPPVSASQSACPEAPVTAVASEEASLNADDMPAEGVYRWKRTGTLEPTTPPIKIPITGFENRLIRNVRRLNPDDYTFEMAQPEYGSQDIVVTTYRVRTNALAERVGSTDQRVGEPDRGVSIVKIERFNAKTGQSVGTFEPVPAVLILPLPVVPGERFQGVGVDTRFAAVLQVDGQVTKRQRIDACGEVVDGWAVDATMTFSGPANPGAPVNYDFVIAPQLGAPLISEHIVQTTPQGKADITFSLGQLKPDSLREDDR